MQTRDLDDRDARNMRWLVLFVLLSLLAHAILALVIILCSIYLPAPKLDLTPQTSPTVNLTLEPAPAPPPPMKRPFMPTSPQANAPHKETQIESDNDTQVASHSKVDRAKDSVMPDVLSKRTEPSDLHDSPLSPSKQKPQPPATPAPPQQAQPKQQPTPPQPQQPPAPPQKAQQPQPQPTPNPPPPVPQKTPAPNPKPVQVDPNGLPVLPPINAPTIAPQVPVTAQQNAQAAVPPPLLPAVASNVQGRAGMSGEPSPEAMATEFGRYKAKVYRAVGSRWYGKVNDQLSVLPVGIVRVQYTIYSDGRVETKVLDGGNGTMQLLLSISVNSILEAAPFDPFSDALKKQIGDSYTDTFSFSIYGGG